MKMYGRNTWGVAVVKKKGGETLTRLHILQSHSTMGSSYVLSRGFIFRATVMAPQWHPPVYILFASAISAGGSGPSNLGGFHSAGGDAPSILPTKKANF